MNVPELLLAQLEREVPATRKALERVPEGKADWKPHPKSMPLDEKPRHVMITDTFSHLAHHRGQLTVYLRLNDQRVPSVYGPTADESW